MCVTEKVSNNGSRIGSSVRIRFIFCCQATLAQAQMSLFDSDTVPVRRRFHLKDPHPRMVAAVMTSSLFGAEVTLALRQHHAREGDGRSSDPNQTFPVSLSPHSQTPPRLG